MGVVLRIFFSFWFEGHGVLGFGGGCFWIFFLLFGGKGWRWGWLLDFFYLEDFFFRSEEKRDLGGWVGLFLRFGIFFIFLSLGF